MDRYDLVVIGGGILGLATARALRRRFPGASIAVLERERAWAAHQSGHNSGVIHSGIYYAPGSLKARLCLAGNASMVAFCRAEGVPFEVCGKLIVATDPSELPRLEALLERGKANGLEARRATPEEVAEREPHVRAIAAIHVPSTGIVDFRQVCAALVHRLEGERVELRLGTGVRRLERSNGDHRLVTDAGELRAGWLVNCAGAASDRLARAAGADPGARIVPFRGEYYELAEPRRGLVSGLVYPVPDPALPFLGVHLTRMIDGSVHVGPNAVPAGSRDGYRWSKLSGRDVASTATWPGWWRLARRYWRTGAKEIWRSISKPAFVAEVRRLLPEIGPADLERAGAGVRAQALGRDGRLLDDFLIVESERATHVCNAPSPAATASLEIAAHIVDRLPATVADRP
ncbi:MAG TPA: L-2-hydroxyglutarate oxidase [Actinomycetes bacterium]